MSRAVGGQQLVLELPHRAALGRDDFLVTDSNRAAVALIDSYPHWPHHAMALVGPPGSGKSHLLEVWRHVTGREVLAVRELVSENAPALLAAGAVALDDAPGGELNERALFHLLNLAHQQGGHVLIAAAQRPVAWEVALPDLATRLKAIPVVEIGLPDDELLRGVMVKLFADRQLAVDASVIAYLVLRMPRSLEAVRDFVSTIDRRALEEKAEVTRAFAGKILQEIAAPGLFPPS